MYRANGWDTRGHVSIPLDWTHVTGDTDPAGEFGLDTVKLDPAGG